MLNSQSRWLRQEYKTNKDKFEKPFKITIENRASESVTTSQFILDQNYKGLGCTVWDGSIALAKMFENDLELIKNLKRFNALELGAGCGLVGLTLVHLGAKFVLLSDMDVCMPTLKENVIKNTQTSTRDSVRVMPYIWGEATTALTKPCGKFDIIVAAEVLYDEADSRLLAQSAMQLLDEGGVMFVSMGRNRNGETAFVEAMNKNGYRTIEVSVLVCSCRC
jgi:predicted nicotinamide N-methyase